MSRFTMEMPNAWPVVPDLIICDEDGFYNIYDLPVYCDIKRLIGFRIKDGKYYFNVDYTKKKLILLSDRNREFSLIVPDDLLRFALGLPESEIGVYRAHNGVLYFTFPTMAYGVHPYDFYMR